MNHKSTHQRAFTLTELIVVIGLIILLITVGMPAIGAMFRSGQLENSLGDVSSSIAAARAYATRDSVLSEGPYIGAAAVFLANDIRIARHSGYTTVDSIPRPVFTDMVDPVPLNPDVGVVAISRSASGTAGLRLVPPPFAMRFDRFGTMIVRRFSSNKSSSVHHEDANGAAGIQEADGMSSVVGVIIYNRADLRAAEGTDITDEVPSTDARAVWVRNNGVAMLVNRYTGAVVKE